MTPPVDDEPSTDSDPPETDQSTTPDDEHPPDAVDDAPETTSDQPEDAIEPPTRTQTETPHQPPAAAPPDAQPAVAPPNSQPAQQVAPSKPREQPDVDSVETPLDAGAVDSNWWYAVAAVPIYVLVGIVGGVFAAVLFLFGIAVDIGGGMGVATGLIVVLLTLGAIGYTLAGLALSILFPVGIYLDAKAVAAAPGEWEPDAVLYLLVGAASVVLSAFTLSAVVALYYLYRRRQAVGVP